jgi:hypothetical protein
MTFAKAEIRKGNKMNNEIDPKMWKVVWVDLPDEIFQETLSAIIIESNHYQIMDIPPLAKNINYLDIVSCSDEDGKLVFTHVHKYSGNRTIRIIFPEYGPPDYSKQFLDILVSMGVMFNDRRAFAAINIPPEANLKEIISLLRKWESEEKLQIEE